MNITSSRGTGPKHITRSALGGKLRSLRRAKKLTQWDLAGLVGVHYSYIGKIESGVGRGPSRALILRLAEALDGDRDELLHLAGKGDERVSELQRMLQEAQESLRQERARSAQLERMLEDKAG